MTEMEKKQQEILQSLEERLAELRDIRQTIIKCKKDYDCAVIELEMVRKQNDRLLTSLKDCANDLCQKCGKYRNEHLGSCDGCKWHDVRNWETD